MCSERRYHKFSLMSHLQNSYANMQIMFMQNLSILKCFFWGTGDKCGRSWARSTINEVQGFPEFSPLCDTERCVQSPGTSDHVCTDDEVGLTLLMVLKDNMDVVSPSSQSSRRSLPPLSYYLLLLLGWIGVVTIYLK